ncbi:hypothetical protein ACOMHN_049187 [Nucella lapillus]
MCCGARGEVGVCFEARGSRSVLWSVLRVTERSALRGSLLSPPLHLHYLLTLSEQQTTPLVKNIFLLMSTGLSCACSMLEIKLATHPRVFSRSQMKLSPWGKK